MSANNDPRLAMVAVELPTGGYRIGTGYLVTPRLVLTAGHVWWGDSENPPGMSAEVWLNGAPWKGAALRWAPPNHEHDACLFELSEDHAVSSEFLWGNYDRSQPVEWHAAGFPVAAEIPQLPGTREIAEASGMLTAEGGGVQDLHEATVTHGPQSI